MGMAMEALPKVTLRMQVKCSTTRPPTPLDHRHLLLKTISIIFHIIVFAMCLLALTRAKIYTKNEIHHLSILDHFAKDIVDPRVILFLHRLDKK